MVGAAGDDKILWERHPGALECRNMMRLAVFALAVAGAFAQNPYNEVPNYGRSRDFDLQHLKLELSFDLESRNLLGTATLTVAPLSGDVRELSLDSAGLEIDSVTSAGRKLAFRTEEQKLIVSLDRQYASGTAVAVTVHYSAHPARGLFFVFPDKFHADRPKQIWANGDTAGGNNRYWFPGYDFPNDKTTTEMLVTVPNGWLALSNGKLAGKTEGKGGTTFHWVQEKPISTYLISLVAGEFDHGEDAWQVPVEYYVPHGRGGDIPRTFGRTVDMLQFFSDHIAPYPWAKYAQAMVDTFGGGMENVSATTEGAAAIIKERDFEDQKPRTDGLIAHEMAHQWFGDLVTCADWRHTWLNEGFATYFEALWEEHAYGRDVFEFKEYTAGRGITSQTSPASVVPPTGQNADNPASAYGLIYNKGGWTLNMVRGQLGDARFWKAIQHYANKFALRTATTGDFVEAITESTGQDLEWLFDQYVYRPGFPDFEASWDYDAGARMAHLSLKQTQKAAGKAALFDVPLEVEILGKGEPRTHTIRANREAQDFYFAADAKPNTVLVDPRNVMLKALKFQKPAAEWIWQLQHAQRVVNRAEAASALGSMAGPEVIAALKAAGTGDAFYGVRIEAALALGRMAGSGDALPAILGDKNAEVRAAAATALGALPKSDWMGNPQVIERLLEAARTDTSFAVRRSAVRAVGRLKPAQGVELLKPFAEERGLRPAVADALGSLGANGGIAMLVEFSKDSDDDVRRSALRAFGNVGKGNQGVTDALLAALHEQSETGDRQAAIFALQQRKETAAVAELQRLAASEPQPNIARAARAAVESINAPARAASPAATQGDLDALRARMAELEKENRELKARFEQMEKK